MFSVTTFVITAVNVAFTPDFPLRWFQAFVVAYIIVVGHAGYYPRFGLRAGASVGLRCQWDTVPAGTFMALVLDEPAMRGVSGVARFRDVA